MQTASRWSAMLCGSRDTAWRRKYAMDSRRWLQEWTADSIIKQI